MKKQKSKKLPNAYNPKWTSIEGIWNKAGTKLTITKPKKTKPQDLYWISSTGWETLKEVQEQMEAWNSRGTLNPNTRVIFRGKVFEPHWVLKLKEEKYEK